MALPTARSAPATKAEVWATAGHQTNGAGMDGSLYTPNHPQPASADSWQQGALGNCPPS